ncbi:MAG TPA: hypothetical protein VFE50_21410 [Cyclobacteriaceae bacterium]|nr:hypothetical protein [Cyclobacteriaceae bacterium]
MVQQGHNHKTGFFIAIGLIGLFAVLTGFSTTFLIPLGEGEFKAPFIIYVHALLAFSWILLFITQSHLIQKNNLNQHRRIGFAGIFVAIGITATFVPVGLYQVEKELAQGFGPTATSSLVGTITSALIFISLVLAGLLKRRVPPIHKRLMLLATILLLWPAWFRFRHFFPSIPNPEIWFAIVLADSLIVVAILWDKIKHRSVHPVLLYVGLFIILEHTVEAYMFDSPLWRELADGLYRLLK